jgi:hypothetical protein
VLLLRTRPIARSFSIELTYLDVKINDENLLPLLLQGNQLDIETMIDASKILPKSFQLKGFIEFEIKLDVSP